MVEHEYRILEINVKKTIAKLETLGAMKVQDCVMKRINFSIEKGQRGRFLRLRDEGTRVTLAYKNRYYEANKERTHEIEIEVGNFQNTLELLQVIGFEIDEIQEQKRIKYKLDNIEFCFDTWPGVPTYLEIEGKTEEDALEGLKLLGFEKEDTMYLAGGDLFTIRYNKSAEDLKNLKF